MKKGAVFGGFGQPSADRVQVEWGGGERDGSMRLKLRLLEAFSDITFVYSDSDDGAAQKALIATSSLVPGNIRSLGETLRIDPKNAVCRVREGRLEPRVE